MRSRSKIFTLILSVILAALLCMCLVFTACTSSQDDDGDDNKVNIDGGDNNEDGTGTGNDTGTNSGNSNDTDTNSGNSNDTGTNSGNSNDTGSDSSTDAGSTYENPGDYLGGAQEMTGSASLTETDLDEQALAAVGTVPEAYYTTAEDVENNATQVTKKTNEITESGAYYVNDDSLEGKKITISADNVTLYLVGATLSNEKKVIESDDYGLTITVIGEGNSITNTTEDTNAISIAGDLVINGTGTLSITTTKNIKANSISIVDASVDITAAGDGLHAEIDSYDDKTVTEAPAFSYEDGGYVYTKNATVSIDAEDDGIQADTFIYIDDGSDITIEAESKGIKAGLIDWGKDGTDLEEGDYLVCIAGGDVTVNSADDAIHSNNTIIITDGNIFITAGDDAIHADDLLQVYGGYIEITDCYEGLEAAKVEVNGGYINLTSSDDGINGADGTEAEFGKANSNCHIIINGGVVYVDAQGDGLDSNGDMLISGGVLYVSGSTSSDDAALDSESGILVTGGYVMACGALGMVETPSTSSTQYVVSYARSTAISAGTILYLEDADGNVLMYYNVPKACQSVIISSPDLVKGSKYYIYEGDTQLCSFTISSIITSVGSSGTSSNPAGGAQGGSSNGSFGGSFGSGSSGMGGGFSGNNGMGSFGKR